MPRLDLDIGEDGEVFKESHLVDAAPLFLYKKLREGGKKKPEEKEGAMIKEAYHAGVDYALTKLAQPNPVKESVKDSYQQLKKEGPDSRLTQSAKATIGGGLVGGGLGTLAGAPLMVHPKTRRYAKHLPYQVGGAAAALGGLLGMAKDPSEVHRQKLRKYQYAMDAMGG